MITLKPKGKVTQDGIDIDVEEITGIEQMHVEMTYNDRYRIEYKYAGGKRQTVRCDYFETESKDYSPVVSGTPYRDYKDSPSW